MGNGNVKKTMIKSNELLEFSKKTQFSQEIILNLNVYFQKFSSILRENGVINYDKFLTILCINDNIFSQHLFYAFDRNHDGDINFREFIQFFGDFKNGDLITKTKLAFKLFCNPQTNKIESKTMYNLLKDALTCNSVLRHYISAFDLENIIQETFIKYNFIIEKNDTSFITNEKSGSHFDLDKSKINISKKEDSPGYVIYNKNNATGTIIPNSKLSNVQNKKNELLSQKLVNNAQNNVEVSYESFSEIISKNTQILNYLDFNLDKLKHYYKEIKCLGCI